MASLSKIFAATTTYPYQVVRSRLQVRTDQGLFDVMNSKCCSTASHPDQRASKDQWSANTFYDLVGLVTIYYDLQAFNFRRFKYSVSIGKLGREG